MEKTTTSYKRFINYFTSLSQLERESDVVELLDTLTTDKDNQTVTFKSQDMFDYYGHLMTINEMYSAIQDAPLERVLDGSEPIKISFDMASFGMYDDEISPIVENILRRSRELLPYTWDMQFAFQKIGETIYFCTITGSRYTTEVNPMRDAAFTGTTFGPDVKSCLMSVEEILPSILGVKNV